VKVILRADVERVGKKGDVIEVADGHARNYLLPKGLAIKASPGALAQAAAMRRSRDLKDAREREGAEAVARALVARVIRIPVRAGSEGRLFGSITAADIVRAVADETGIELDRRKLHLDDPIKTVGTHEVPVKLHPEVEFRIVVEAVPACLDGERHGHESMFVTVARRPLPPSTGRPQDMPHVADSFWGLAVPSIGPRG
jgi:large subunit ribosomal protein L9